MTNQIVSTIERFPEFNVNVFFSLLMVLKMKNWCFDSIEALTSSSTFP